jgi:hypothetical protein
MFTENANVREIEVESGGNLVVLTETRLEVTNAIDTDGGHMRLPAIIISSYINTRTL